MNQDFDFSLYFTHNILIYKLFGFWRPDEDMQQKKVYNCYTALCTFAWVICVLSQITYIIKNKQDVQEVTAALYVTVTFTITMVKMLFIYNNMNDIKVLLKELNKPLFQVKFQKHYDIAIAAKRMTQVMFYFCLYIGVQTQILWSVVPFLGDERTTLTKGWFPYDWNKPLNYVATYIFQSYVSTMNTIICLNLDTFTATLLIQVGIQCDFLCTTLSSLDDFVEKDGVLYEMVMEDKMELRKNREKFSNAMTKNLVVCIKHHRCIMRIAKDIERIHRASVFVLFTGGAFIMCSCLFQLSVIQIGTSEFFMLTFYLLCIVVEQLLYCWFGNEVIFKSSLILQSAYNTPWTECNVKFQKILLQFMTQNSRPIKIVAGELFTMSVPVFISQYPSYEGYSPIIMLTLVLRTSYSYFSLLQGIQ